MFDKLKEAAKVSLLGKKELYSTQLASFDYYQLELEYCYKKLGSKQNILVEDSVQLVDEKDNEHDPNAMAVYLLNLHIGYVPASDTQMIREFKHKEPAYIRLYEYSGKYRAELNIVHRI